MEHNPRQEPQSEEEKYMPLTKELKQRKALAEPTWLTADPNDEGDWEQLAEQETRDAGKRVKQAVKTLRGKGILDATGKLTNPELPAEMFRANNPIAE